MTEEADKDKKHVWDKVLMGAVIGGAIGSVMGAAVAPKRGKSSKGLFSKIKKLFGEKSENLK